MADTPDNPPPPERQPDPPKEPWRYSADTFGAYIPPTSVPGADAKGQPPAEPASASPPPTPLPPPRAPSALSAAGNPKPDTVGPRARPTGQKEDDKEDGSIAGVIDTIEAIIIALIVALTFRAFIVEAFVIPTGSMAPTLLGAHYKVICPECGYEFDLDARLEHQLVVDKATGQLVIPKNAVQQAELGPNRDVPLLDQDRIICPNCRYAISPQQLPQYLESPLVIDEATRTTGRVPLIWANNGDRILVMKYLYSVMEPKRWDVIVFKEPEKGEANYIKRLIGLPNETLEIVNGDIYVGPPGDENPEHWQIARKPDDIQNHIWQLVFDNDYYPVDEGLPRTKHDLPDWKAPVWTNPWEPGKDWQKGPVMKYTGSGPSMLQFHQTPPGAPDTYPPYGLNTLGYNSDQYVDDVSGGNGEFSPRSLVGDLRLETRWTPQNDASRDLHLTLGRPNNCYRLAWNTQGMKLEHFNDNVVPPVWEDAKDVHTIDIPGVGSGPEHMPAPEAGRSYELALNNVDHSIAFYIDGKKILWQETPWSAADALLDLRGDPQRHLDPHPADWTNAQVVTRMPLPADVTNAPPNTMIQIDVGGPCDLSHLRVLRDLYYTQVSDNWLQKQRAGRPATAIIGSQLHLGPDEFFAMGDNSRRSNDGRLWEKVDPPLEDLALQAGVVPRRYLLGKAFFVYWPAGFTPVPPTSSIPILRDLPLIPNAGDWRIIR